MSCLWLRDDDGTWRPQDLDADLVRLTAAGPIPLTAREQLGASPDPVLARARDDQGRERWTLLCPPEGAVHVNGERVGIGARVLVDRDAVTLAAGHTTFFCVAQLAQMVPYPGERDADSCIRCKLPLLPATPAVRCPGPGCGFWHHQSQERPCWTYAEGCASCGHPTAFDAGFQWTPDEL